MPLSQQLSQFCHALQADLFGKYTEVLGPLLPCHQRLVAVLELVCVEAQIPIQPHGVGRPPADRRALARALIAKSICKLPTTAALIDRLRVDRRLRQIVGWQRAGEVPSEAVFSRAFSWFSKSQLPARTHAALIRATHEERIVGHVSHDATAIEARERPLWIEPVMPAAPAPSPVAEAAPTTPLAATVAATPAAISAGPPAVPAAPAVPKRRRGRPRKHPLVVEAPTRIERQPSMTLDAMLADLPRHCAVGTKTNAKGRSVSWTGYKLHLSVADGDLPLSFLLTSASLHDSQAAIPLMTMTAERVTSLYDLMDKAYDVAAIRDYAQGLGHIPIIPKNPRKSAATKAALATEELARHHANLKTAEDTRYNQRSSVERINGNLKDNYGGRHITVRGAEKIMCHLGFGLLALTAEALLRLVA